MELGFYHPDTGYWQSIGGDAETILADSLEGTIQVPLKPGVDYEWQNGEWVYVEPTPIVPDRVTANQFGKQLAALDLMDQVTAWVNQQDTATQWSFNRSATFVRNDSMMQSGFTALGFTTEQIDQFFIDAAKL